MANVLGELFGDIADAIREKTGTGETMKPVSFPDAIRGIRSEPAEVDILPQTTLDGFAFDGNLMMLQTTADYSLVLGESYFVVWDGVTYECVGQDMSVMVSGAVGLGNLALFGGTGNGEPFALGAVSGMALYAAMDGTASHTVRIYQQSVGSLADLRYVSFLSHNGAQLYGRKPVAVGDDCADPIARGIFTTPTRASSARYHYTFAGWARSAGGSVDGTALKAVNENRSLYANFTAAVRYYTINYYDSDGVTVLKTESLAYGSIPDYVPVKVGYTFNGWTSEILSVTKDASYTAASWTDKMDFGALTWAQISNYCKTQDVSKLFDIGQQKTFTFKTSVGETTAAAQIVGFYHDDLADGSGKAPITLRLIECYTSNVSWHGTGTAARQRATWEVTDIRSLLHSFAAHATYGPEKSLKDVMKKVSKVYRMYEGGYATSDDFWFLPSLAELGYQIDGAQEGSCYAAYTDGKALDGTYSDLCYLFSDHTAHTFWTRTKLNYGQAYRISENGKAESVTHGTSSTDCVPLIFMCIG